MCERLICRMRGAVGARHRTDGVGGTWQFSSAASFCFAGASEQNKELPLPWSFLWGAPQINCVALPHGGPRCSGSEPASPHPVTSLLMSVVSLRALEFSNGIYYRIPPDFCVQQNEIYSLLVSWLCWNEFRVWPPKILYGKPKCRKLQQKRIIFWRQVFFCFVLFLCVCVSQAKIQLTMQGKREKRCRFVREGLTFACNSPNLHVRVVGVHYCKGSCWRIKQLPQKITVIWHTQTFGGKVELWEGGKGEFRTARGREDASSSRAQGDPLTTPYQLPSFGELNQHAMPRTHDRDWEGGLQRSAH